VKKIVTFVALMLLTIAGFAQSTSSRNTVNRDYSSNVIGYKDVSVTDAASATVDTINLYPNSAVVRYTYTAVDSADLKLKSTAGCFKGDQLILYVTNAAISNVMYLDSKFKVSTGTNKITLTTGTRSYLRFIFDGKNYLEADRLLNYTY
jgi:hypothetical protein